MNNLLMSKTEPDTIVQVALHTTTVLSFLILILFQLVATAYFFSFSLMHYITNK